MADNKQTNEVMDFLRDLFAPDTFENPEFGRMRIIREGNKFLFCAKDVAMALGYKDPTNAIKTHCRWVVKHHLPHPQSPNKQVEANFIPEGDVYRLITHSKLPNAEKFEHWVFDEILPSIGRNGFYSADPNVVYEQAMKTIQDMMMPVVESMKMLAPIVTDLTHRVDKLEHAHYNVDGFAVLPSISGMSVKEWSDYQIRNVKVIAYSQGKTEKEVLSSIYRAMEDRNKMVLREQIKNESGSVFAAVGRNHSLRYMFDEAMNTKLQGYGLSPARIPIRDGQ